MKTVVKNLFIIFSCIFIFLVLGTINSMASGDLYLNELNFEANINSDGSMDVVETWDIDIEETNTLFKTFETDRSKYSGITNVKVYETTKGIQKSFTQINQLMYHVTEECYYGLINDDGDFEIAWGVGLDNSSATKTYKISYTVKDAVSKHSDYAQLYWQFVGEDFGISSDKITGTITLPSNASNKEEIKVWGHTEDLNGEIYATGLNKIEFTINDFRSGRYVEIRTLFPTSMITSTNRSNNIAILDDVIKEETVWANEANARRTQRAFINGLITVVIDFVLILISFVFISNMIKKKKKLKGMKKLTSTENIIYFREMPRKNATPAQATYLYKKIKTEMQSYDLGKIFSATLLHFNLKKIIDFQVNKDLKGKDNVSIKMLDRTGNAIGENREEKAIFDFLLSAFDENNKEEITVKELQKFIEKHSSKILKLQEKIQSGTKEDLRDNKLLDKEEEKKYEKATLALVGYIMSVMFSSIFGVSLAATINVYILIGVLPLFVLSIINLILTSIELSRINIYTQEGVNESEKWKGLKKYMEEFSMLDKREVPEIVIWEEFLVYATAFGIADKVLKQLKIVYPNFENSIDVNTYSGMYLMMNTDFSNSFSNAISSSMSSAYSSASGGGGGFSGGGGGGRRPEVEEEVDSMTEKEIIFPNYEHSILNTINSILKYYKVKTKYKGLKELDKILEKEYKNIVFIILDGMGEHVLRDISPDGFFMQNHKAKVTSVCPSTTTAAITTYYSGKPPIETGWIAMSQYFKEYGRALEMLRKTDSYTGEKIQNAKIDVFDLIKYITIYEQIEQASPEVKAYEINHTYCDARSSKNIHADTIEEMCESIQEVCNNQDRNFILAYSDKPDTILHKYGCKSQEVKEFILHAEEQIEKMCNSLNKKETLVIISADHGHKDIDKIYKVTELEDIQDYLIMPPSLESRAVTFWVKEDRKQEFEKSFKEKFQGEFLLFTKEEFLEKEFLGIGNKNAKIDDFIGNYIAIAIGSSIIKLGTHISKEKADKKATHCGFTPNEMEVPVIVI